MAKAIHLASWFLTGCIAASALAWVGKFDGLDVAVRLLFFLVLVMWALAWLLDDAVIQFLKIDARYYYSLLFGIGSSVFVGGVVGCLAFLVQQT